MTTSAHAAHGYAMWGELKYPTGFAHFDYVNPIAPKGGELRLVSNQRVSNFDKYNPFTMKGTAPAYLSEMLFETLLTGSLDESGSAYGLLAQDVAVASDGLSVTFMLHPRAKFHNGDAVHAKDVKHSFDTLNSDFTSPAYKTVLADVSAVTVLDARTVRFQFKRPNRELPLTVGGLPIFSHKWGMDATGKSKPFDQLVMDVPIGSGPYKIGPVQFGRDITYVRDPNYWGQDLNVRVGTANFDRITVKIYKDGTARLEGLKAGEFDVMRFFSAGDWARRLYGRKFNSGELVKGEFKHGQPTGFQSYVLNTRRAQLQDVRVRQALGLAMDFEWMRRQLFYNAYDRVQGMFGNTDCAATGLPSTAELALLEPWRGKIPDAAFGPMAVPPRTDQSPTGLRDNLRQARDLLRDAGWVVQNGKLTQTQGPLKGQVMRLEYLDSAESGIRTVGPWIQNLQKLGIELTFRPVDFALYQERLSNFNFDMISIAYGGTNNPGQEFADMFGAKAADTPESGNFPGVKSPAVDALIERMSASKTRNELLPACRALDRVIAHRHVLIPQWYGSKHRMVYNDWRLARPDVPMPPLANGETWVMDVWWAKPSSDRASNGRATPQTSNL